MKLLFNKEFNITRRDLADPKLSNKKIYQNLYMFVYEKFLKNIKKIEILEYGTVTDLYISNRLIQIMINGGKIDIFETSKKNEFICKWRVGGCYIFKILERNSLDFDIYLDENKIK